jgi:hypothetical protein
MKLKEKALSSVLAGCVLLCSFAYCMFFLFLFYVTFLTRDADVSIRRKPMSIDLVITYVLSELPRGFLSLNSM